MLRAVKTANLAIAFTDLHGFSERSVQLTLEQSQALLRAQAELLVPLFRAFGGRVVKTLDASYLVTFESPTQAVLCGAAIQDRLWEHNRTAADGRLELAVAINLGEVRIETGDVFGEPVNIAARVKAITPAGEVYFTEAVYLAMNKAEVPSREVGPFELKGVPGSVRVFQVPRAPYRVTAAADAPAPMDERPFGGVGLARVETGGAAALLGRAAAVGQSASGWLARTWPALREGRLSTLVAATALGIVSAGILAFALARGSEVDRALADLEKWPVAERAEHAEQAQRLIDSEKDSTQQVFDAGRLDELLGATTQAVRSYHLAADAGHRGARRRLIELLASPDCRTRVMSAETIGELKLESARSALEALARSGGPGDGPNIPVFGCNSQRAAEEALRALEAR